MFFLRGAIIALAVFGILYIGVSGAIAGLARLLPLRRQRAGSLFVLRTLPLWAAAVVVALLTVPSFVYLEPRQNAEPVGTFAWLAAAVAVLLVSVGVVRGVHAGVKARRFRTSFVRGSKQMTTSSGLRGYQFPSDEPVILVTGLLRPTVLVSSAAVALLDANELEAAMRHELAHAAHTDNLRKLLLRFCAFPLLDSLEARWKEETEMAADAAAVRDDADALDLASALLKMAQKPARLVAPELSLALVSGEAAAVEARVQRLLAPCARHTTHARAAWTIAVALAVAAALNYGWLLAGAHELSEFLIR